MGNKKIYRIFFCCKDKFLFFLNYDNLDYQRKSVVNKKSGSVYWTVWNNILKQYIVFEHKQMKWKNTDLMRMVQKKMLYRWFIVYDWSGLIVESVLNKINITRFAK